MRRPLPAPVPALLLTMVLAAAALAGCGGPGGPAPDATATPGGDGAGTAPAARAELAAHAAAAKDLVGVTFYTLVTPEHPERRTVMVVRAADGGWRVDVPGGALGGTVDVSIVGTGDGEYHCTTAGRPDEGGGAGCVAVDRLAAAADPRVQHVFTDWLDVLVDRSAAVSVVAAEPPDGMAGDCFAVEPSAASLLAPLDPGVYCYRTDGTLTGARLDLGTLTLARADGAAPPSVELPAPVVTGDPLPTTSPTPSAPPTPSAAPTATAAGSP